MKASSRWTKKRILFAGGALVAIGAAATWGVLQVLGPRVETVRVGEREIVQTVVASGRVAPPARIELGLLVSGIVSAVHVEEGAHVLEGELLLELDDAEARAMVAQALARVRGARASAGSVRRVQSPLAAQASIQAGLGVERAQAELGRLQQLFAAGATTRAALDDARRALELARSQAQGAAVQSLSVGASGAESRGAAAQLAEAEAALDAAEARLSQTRLVARAAGVIVDRLVEPGDVAQPGRTLIALNRDGAAELVVTPDEQNLALLREGQPAVASADAFPDDRFAARVAFIAPAVDARRGTIEVHLSVSQSAVSQPPAALRSEMTVSVEIEVGRAAHAIALPVSVVRDAGTETPWVLVAQGSRAVRRSVRIGLRGDAQLEIRSGLRVGDLVVDDAELAPGARMRPRAPRGQE